MTKEKSKISMKPIVKYLRELSIVVAGIAITVGTGLWVNDNNNKKDQKQYLEAIKLELEENVRQFDDYAKWLQKPIRYAEYLLSNQNNALNEDTLAYYVETDNDGCGYGYSQSVNGYFPTNAFEMLKFSGSMRQIENKELLQDIWSVYAHIEEARHNIDRIFQRKEEEVDKLMKLYEDGKKVDVPMRNFHTHGLPYEMVRYCKQASEHIKETLSKFE
jgi:hypothetical protein